MGFFSLIVKRHVKVSAHGCGFVPTLLILQKNVHEKGRRTGFEKPGTSMQHSLSLLMSRANAFRPGDFCSRLESMFLSSGVGIPHAPAGFSTSALATDPSHHSERTGEREISTAEWQPVS